jgi:hypothetical protein
MSCGAGELAIPDLSPEWWAGAMAVRDLVTSEKPGDTEALKRALTNYGTLERAPAKRKRELGIPEVAGGATCTTIQDVCNYLDTVNNQITAELNAQEDGFLLPLRNSITNGDGTYYNLASGLTDLATGVADISARIDESIVDTTTYPTANLTDLAEDLTSGLADLRNQVGYPGVDGTSIYVQTITILNELDIVNESVENAETQATTAATNTAALLATSSITSLIVGLAKAAGGSLEVSLLQILAQFFANPPLQLLHPGTITTITSGAVLTFPVGAYGINITFTVPASWGRTAGAIPLFIPAVAYIAWQNGLGYTGTPEAVNTSPISIFPLPSNASSIQIVLPVGITGLYYWLLL